MHASGIDFPKTGIGDGAVLLRPLTYDDIPAIISACEDAAIRRFNSAPRDEAAARAWVDGSIEERPSLRAFRLAIADSDSGSLLGSLGVPEVDFDAGRAEVGYWLSKPARGRGLATRAVRLFCSWGFSELPLARIEAIPEVENEGSHRVLERVGFKREGVLRSFAVVRGQRRDMVMFSLLPGDLD